MKKKRPPLSEAQLEIMNIVWANEEVTVNTVWTILKEYKTVARNTVQTLMSRLDEKNWLQHRKESNIFYYSATVPQKKTLSGIADKLLKSAFGGSVDNLVMALFDGGNISKEDSIKIKNLIDKHEDKQS